MLWPRALAARAPASCRAPLWPPAPPTPSRCALPALLIAPHPHTPQFTDESLVFTLTGITNNKPQGVVISSGSMTSGTYFGGDSTVTGQMDTLKNNKTKATYQGFFQGLGGYPVATVGGDEPITVTGVNGLRGDAQLTADFGAGTIGGNIYNMQNVETATTAGYGIRMDGTISGSSYTGTAKYTPAATATGMAGTSGNGSVIGGFFGANAAETAGVVTVTGEQGTACTSTSCFVTGGFGAKKQP